jgi:hypothetical protein
MHKQATAIAKEGIENLGKWLLGGTAVAHQLYLLPPPDKIYRELAKF